MRDFGVYPWATLEQRISQAKLRRLLATGGWVRARHGWYGSPDADPLVLQAVRLGGALSCVAALRTHGIWVPPMHQRLHIRGGAKAHARYPHRYCSQ